LVVASLRLRVLVSTPWQSWIGPGLPLALGHTMPLATFHRFSLVFVVASLRQRVLVSTPWQAWIGPGLPCDNFNNTFV
jgi:hypothetical protein